MADGQLIALARKYGAEYYGCVKGEFLFTTAELRSLLKAVADASYERAAKQAYVDQRRDQSYFACIPLDELKGTLPEMEPEND